MTPRLMCGPGSSAHADCFPQLIDAFVDFTDADVRETEIVDGFDKIRIRIDRCLEMRKCFGVAMHGVEGVA